MPERCPRAPTLALLLLGALNVALPSCRASQPLPPAVEAGWREDDQARPKAARRRATVRLESEYLSGTFDAALVYRQQPAPAARLQLFASVGGKVLDLTIDERGVKGYFPHAGRGLAHRWEQGAAPRHLLMFFALTLIAEHARGAARPVLESWVEEGGWHARQTLPYGGAEVTTRLDPTGRVLARELELRGARWKLLPSAPGRFRVVAPDVLLDVRLDSERAATTIPDSLFELDLPAGLRR